MDVYLIDGTYELFRHFYAVPPARDREGREVGAVRGVLRSLLGMMTVNTTHIGVATDHVIESFRNQLWAGYKTGDGIDPDLLAQFPLLEEMLSALGVAVWPMVEFEADDALAAAAASADADPRVSKVFICTPDKDLAQSVRGTRVVQMERRARTIRDEDGVIARFGVPPASIPDYLALVGDSADGYPGITRWGAKSAAAVLAAYRTLEAIPNDATRWSVKVRGADALAANLREHRADALLFRELARLRTDAPIGEPLDALRFSGPDVPALERWAARLGDGELVAHAERAAAARAKS